MRDIIIKEVTNEKGDFSHLELCQGSNVVSLYIGNTSLDLQKKLYKWDFLKDAIDKIRKEKAGM